MLHSAKLLLTLFFGIVLLLFPSVGLAQVQEIDYTKTKEERKAGRAFRNNFFRQRGFSSLLDVLIAPPRFRPVIEFEQGLPVSYDQLLTRDSYLTLLGYTYELRYNLWNHRDFLSISAGTPMSMSFSVNVSGNSGGFMHAKVPLLLDVNLFAHSTYNNISDYGFFAGFGPQVVAGTILGGQQQQLWTEWLVRVGAKHSIFGHLSYISLEYGFSGQEEYLGINGLESTFKSQSARLVLGKVLNY